MEEIEKIFFKSDDGNFFSSMIIDKKFSKKYNGRNVLNSTPINDSMCIIFIGTEMNYSDCVVLCASKDGAILWSYGKDDVYGNIIDFVVYNGIVVIYRFGGLMSFINAFTGEVIRKEKIK